jgi:CRP-like cAMP-binding protein
MSLIENAVLPFNILAMDDTEILFVNCNVLLEKPAVPTPLIRNLLGALASQVFLYRKKMNIVCQRSLPASLLAFFENHYVKYGKDVWFSIPYNREAFAEYLCVNRGALSRELSHMKRDGILDFHKSKFKICIPLLKQQ